MSSWKTSPSLPQISTVTSSRLFTLSGTSSTEGKRTKLFLLISPTLREATTGLYACPMHESSQAEQQTYRASHFRPVFIGGRVSSSSPRCQRPLPNVSTRKCSGRVHVKNAAVLLGCSRFPLSFWSLSRHRNMIKISASYASSSGYGDSEGSEGSSSQYLCYAPYWCHHRSHESYSSRNAFDCLQVGCSQPS